ncbi:hypothetical protein D3C83_289350 [compost metagenome]
MNVEAGIELKAFLPAQRRGAVYRSVVEPGVDFVQCGTGERRNPCDTQFIEPHGRAERQLP